MMSKKNNTKKRIQELLATVEIPETRPESVTPQPSKEVISELREAVLNTSQLSKKDKTDLEKVSWEEFLNAIDRDERIGFSFDQNKVMPLEEKLDSNETSTNALLRVGDEVFGKIQLDGEDDLSSEETKLLTSIAQQVSQHIENLRLVEQANQYRTEAEEASRQLTQKGWEDYLQATGSSTLSYIYDQKRVVATDDVETITNFPKGEVLTKVISVRNEPIGGGAKLALYCSKWLKCPY